MQSMGIQNASPVIARLHVEFNQKVKIDYLTLFVLELTVQNITKI